MTEDLLRDLVEYKTYKDKGVMMASKSLIQLFRSICPDLLHRRDRGRPTEASVEVKRREFGELDVKEFVPGAEVIDVNEEEGASDQDGNDSGSEGEDDLDETKDEKDIILSLEDKAKKAREATVGKILTDEDFLKIDAAQLKKQVVGFRKGGKGRKRTAAEADLDEEAEEAAAAGRNELVNLEDIEMIYKKKKHDKEARMEAVLGGREDREKFGGKQSKKAEGASITNKQKSKKKNFSMMKHKIKAKGKKSFREKQVALKKRLVKIAKNSH